MFYLHFNSILYVFNRLTVIRLNNTCLLRHLLRLLLRHGSGRLLKRLLSYIILHLIIHIINRRLLRRHLLKLNKFFLWNLWNTLLLWYTIKWHLLRHLLRHGSGRLLKRLLRHLLKRLLSLLTSTFLLRFLFKRFCLRHISNIITRRFNSSRSFRCFN